MFWNKEKPRVWMDIVEEGKPNVGDLYRVIDGVPHRQNLLYFTEIGSPTLEGPDYRYKYFNDKLEVLNDDVLSEPRNIDQPIIEGQLIKVEDPVLIAKISLFT